jgi:hypothetical protein
LFRVSQGGLWDTSPVNCGVFSEGPAGAHGKVPGVGDPARSNEHPFLRMPLSVVLLVALVLFACLGGLGYWLNGDPWNFAAGTIGWLLGMLLLRLPPVHRRINQHYAKRNALEPPDVP